MEPLSSPSNLLILTSKEDEAEAIVTSLRNAGLAVRGVFTGDLQRVEELVITHPFALILCCDFDPAINLAVCMDLYRDLRIDTPMLIVADPQTDPSDLIGAMRAGARDLIEHGDTDHLQLVVARELDDYRNRRLIERLRERLHECEQRAQGTMDASAEAVAFVQEGMHVQANPAYRELFGFTSEDDLDGYPLLDLIAPERQGDLRHALRQLDRLGDGEAMALTLESECVRADNSRFGVRISISTSTFDGEACLRVIVQEAGADETQTAPGLIDADTGLPNRTAFLADLARRLARKGAEAVPVAVIYVGVDLFAKLIQSEGLTSGLQAVAGISGPLREAAPPGAYIARVCDDAFALLVDDLRQSDVIDLATRIIDKVRLPLAPGAGREGERVCGSGIVLAEPGKGSAADTLNTVYRDYLFGSAIPEPVHGSSTQSLPTMPESGYHSELSEEDRRFAANIRRALEGDGFQLVYQPIVSLKGDSQENYNVFVRLRDDDKRLREAKEFLAAAVRSGRMVAIDRWVIRHAIEELAQQRAQERKLNFFVNIAEESLQEDKLLIWICDYLREYRARGSWLTFQILEDHARRHAAAFAKLSEGLKKVKCRVALNRFGLGPSPEVLLKNLHADFVKFAPELAGGLADDEAKQRRLLALTDAVRDNGMRSVFTGVEDARTLTVLWTAGIDYVQGNFLQRPQPTIEPL